MDALFREVSYWWRNRLFLHPHACNLQWSDFCADAPHAATQRHRDSLLHFAISNSHHWVLAAHRSLDLRQGVAQNSVPDWKLILLLPHGWSEQLGRALDENSGILEREVGPNHPNWLHWARLCLPF